MDRKPNVLFVFGDQHREMDLECSGNADLRTPNFNRLAEGGTRFTNAISNCPVCTPIRGSFMTGLYPHHHGALVNDIPIRTDNPAMGTIFRDNGYATGYIGKWHLDGCPRDKFTPPGERRLGFDYWAVHNCTHNYNDTWYYTDIDTPVPIDGYNASHETGLACEFMEKKREEPWCLVLSWGPPHAPLGTAPEEHRARYDPEKVTLQGNVPETVDEAQVREDLHGYYAHISALDECMGRLLDKIDELELTDDTIVIYTSDHGDMLHSHGRMKKQQPWEESIHVPFIIRWPGKVGKGTASDELISLVDFLPSLIGLTGVNTPPEWNPDGLDLSATWRGEKAGREAALLLDYFPVDQGSALYGLKEWRGLRTRRYTYARELEKNWVLYDNENDPLQMHNLIDTPAAAKLLEELEEELQKELRQADDSFQSLPEMLSRMGLEYLYRVRQQCHYG